MKTVFVEPNAYGKKIPAEIKEFNDVLYHEKLVLSRDHTLGKIDLPVDLQGLNEVKPVLHKEYKVEKLHNLYCAGNTLVSWMNLKAVAEDGKILGLLKNAKIETLFAEAKFLVQVAPDKPLIIKLGAITYFIAPVVEN